MLNVLIYQVTAIQRMAESLSQLTFLPQTTHLTYEAGQYVEVITPETASFLSIANAPTTDHTLTFHLFHPKENKKALALLNQAQQEKCWRIRGPLGTCTANRLHPTKPIIFLAREAGFAPIKAVLEILFRNRFPSPVFFYWSVKNEASLYLQEMLKEWLTLHPNFHFRPIFTQETGSHIPPSVILGEHSNLSDYQVYISGPKPLVITAYEDFVNRGLHQDWFFSDVLTPTGGLTI